MKIVLAGPYPTETQATFAALLPGCEFISVSTQRDYDALREGEVIVVRVLKTTEETLKNKADLKAVIRWGAGFDSVDIAAAGRRGVMVSTTPGGNSYAVSELAVALMLAVGRKIVNQNARTHGGIWDNKLFSEQMTTLNHKTVGIIGGGNIGRGVSKQVQVFGASAIYYDVAPMEKEMEKKYNMRYQPLNDLIHNSDVITLHVPLTEENRHMIGAEEIKQMKDHVIIVNTARGGLIDDLALAEALRSGKVSGAGLDCVENENMEESPFAGLEQVIMTPHMGGTTNDLSAEMVPRIAAQIRLYTECGNLNYIVNRQYLKQNAVNA